jgi:type VI secretion system protein ImpH
LPELLREEPWMYRFFQACRLVQLLLAERGPVGRFHEPASEALRFRSRQTLGFPASEIQSLEAGENGPPRMEVNFLGLTGPVGELPRAMTEYILARRQARDHGPAEFFDIFNHRWTSLFYRAWEKYRFGVQYERGEREGLTHHLLDTVGLGTEALQDRQDVPDEVFLYYAGLLAQKPRSATALKLLIEDHFDVPVHVEQFVGAWRKLDAASQCRLEDDDSVPSARLGLGAVAGDEVWDPQSMIRLRLGPLPLARYLEFLPDGPAYPALRALVRFFSSNELDFEVQLVLRREEAPALELGASGLGSSRLGWVSWVRSRPMGRDPDDTMFRL